VYVFDRLSAGHLKTLLTNFDAFLGMGRVTGNRWSG